MQKRMLLCLDKSQEEKHVIDSRNRQAAPVRRLRNRRAKKQRHCPSEGCQKQNKGPLITMLKGQSLLRERDGERCLKTTDNPGHRSVSSHVNMYVCVFPWGGGTRREAL